MHQHQTLLTADRLKAPVMELTPIISELINPEEENISGAIGDLTEDHAPKTDLKNDSECPSFPLFERAAEVSKTDLKCLTANRAWTEDKAHYENINLRACSLKDDILYRKDKLWVSADDQLRLEILQKVHNPSVSSHSGITHTEALLQWYYFWLRLQASVERYCRNCHDCWQAKASREKLNELLQPLPIPVKRWEDIVMNFITDLPESEGKNVILIIIDCLSKEHHYVPCTTNENSTSAEETAEMIIQNVFRLHELPASIVSDRESQFVSIMWKALCKRLSININLSTAFHSQTDEQSERVNQDIESHLQLYCDYYQDDWVKHLPMREFTDNNNVSSATEMCPFFVNKGFHPQMSFSPDTFTYESTRERLLVHWAEDIAETRKEGLTYMKEQLERAQTIMANNANRRRKDVTYKVGQEVFLDRLNIKAKRLCLKLDDKNIGPYKILQKVETAYRLELPASMKIHLVFHVMHLRAAATDPLPGQINAPPGPVIIDDRDEWVVDNALDGVTISDWGQTALIVTY